MRYGLDQFLGSIFNGGAMNHEPDEPVPATASPSDYYGLGIGMMAGRGDKDYGYNPDTGLPNQPKQTYQPPLNSMLPGYTQPNMAQSMPTVPSQDYYQTPLNSMRPGYTQPDMSQSAPTYHQGSEFYGPDYNPDRQAQFQQMDYGVDRSASGAATTEAERGGPWGGTQASPYAVLDNFMSRDPVHTLGVNGFRTGASGPFVDYSGPMQRQQAIRNNFNISDMLGRQDAVRDSHSLDLQRMIMMSGDRRDAIRQRQQAEFDRNFQRLPPGKQGPFIDQGELSGSVTPEAAAALRVRELMDIGAMASGGMNKETGQPKSLERFMQGIASAYVPGKHNADELRRRFIGMGIKPEDIAKFRGKSAIGQLAEAILGPAANAYDEMNSAQSNIPWYSSFTGGPERQEYFDKKSSLESLWR